MKRFGVPFIVVAVIICFGVVAAMLVNESPNEGFSDQITGLRRLMERDSELNQRLLEAWLLTPHYDELNQAVEALAKASDAIEAPPHSATEALDQRDLARLRKAMLEKESRIERFKTGQAVLRNSVQYFSVVSGRVLSSLGPPDTIPLMNALTKLRTEMLSFRAGSEPTKQLEGRIDAVAQLWKLAPPSARAELDHTVQHARQIVSRSPQVRGEVEDALALPTSAVAGQVLARYNIHLQDAIRATRAQRTILGISAVALIGLIAWVSMGLWRSRLSLKTALDALNVERKSVTEQNERLEAQVKERTRELGLRNDELENNVRLLTNTQNQLAVAGRMATVGTMAAGIAHEINNPLAFVTSNVHYVLQELDGLSGWAKAAKTTLPLDLADVLVALRDVETGSQRVVEIVKGLKRFSHMDEKVSQTIDVRQVLEFALTMAASPIRQRAELIKGFGEVPYVMANEAELGQVFLNLLVNASQAIGEDQPQGKIQVTTRTTALGQACIEVTDSGCGMNEAVKARVFDPFFTTKPIGQGTGLGLSICYGIIKGFGGTIEVDTAPGAGSTFRVLLPAAAAADAADAVDPLGAKGLVAVARTRILIIDDEEKVGDGLLRMLSTEHDVVAVTEGRAALDLIAAGQRFDLILCDLMMPTMGGHDFKLALAQQTPEQLDALVFLSGGAVTPRAEAFAAAEKDRFFAKPMAPRDLQDLVRKYSPRAA